MKGNLILLWCFLVSAGSFGQEISTNRNPIGLEHNALFNATTRYTVTQSGAATLWFPEGLFDGSMKPYYSGSAVDENDPTVIEISGLPGFHTQVGAWFGWSTRWWMPTRFLMEAYGGNHGVEEWVTVADYTSSDYSGDYSFVARMPPGAFTKLRITIYKSDGYNGRFGISELFYIHPEMVSPYEGLYEYDQAWTENGTNLYYNSGNILIGKTSQINSTYKLDVDGKMRANEIKVNLNGADFVFEDDYDLPTLKEVEDFILKNQHLPDIEPATEMQTKGVYLGDFNTKLLQKIEELTLYLIKQNKRIEVLENVLKQNASE